MVKGYEFSGDRMREGRTVFQDVTEILPVFLKFLTRIRSNSVQDMSTESYSVIVIFFKTAAIKAIFYLGT
jgi:hypothetical protein